MRPEDLTHLKTLGIELDQSKLYCSDPKNLVAYARQSISKLVSELEAGAKSLASLGEDGISTVIATALNQTAALTVTRETNSNGHADLTITAPTYCSPAKFKYIGEAKIWRDKQYCIDGFEQLMGYITGRQEHSFTIIYFRIQRCDTQFSEYILELLRQKGGSNKKKESRSATTSHQHASTAVVEIDHFALHLPL